MNDGTPNLPVWADGLSGKIALVTGAGKGLGRACALALSAAGAKVIGVARSRDDLVTLQNDASNEVVTWTMDVNGPEILEKIESLDRLDVLVNNAGTNQPQSFLDVTEDALDHANAQRPNRVCRRPALGPSDGTARQRLHHSHEFPNGSRWLPETNCLLHDQTWH